MIDFSKVLNPEQCAAATAGNGPILVLAAAGTGKTRTLVHRVAYLVEQGVPASRILLLTFTNRAAREMLERAELVVGPQVGGIWSGTFHHICARFLRRYGELLGYPPGFQILDEDDAKKVLGECIKIVAPDDKDFPKKELVLKMISDAANRERTVEDIARQAETKVAGINAEQIAKVAQVYALRKKELASMDFDDLLVNGLRLLRENEYVRNTLQEHFLHVLVDEYQDTNTLQAQFVDLLAQKSRNLMAVGDDFQCIYTWRGAQFENIMDFPRRWPGCKVMKLERNYRSLRPILDVANIVMKDAPHQFEKTLRPARTGEGTKPQLWSVTDGHAQADAVLAIVQALHRDGIPRNSIAVLYRSHFNAIDIQLTLARNKVPYHITSGVGFFEQIHVKDVIAFLRICLDTKAELSFERLVALLPGVGDTSAKKYWGKCGNAFAAADADSRARLGGMLGAKAKTYWPALEAAFAAATAHHAAGEDATMVNDFYKSFYAGHLSREFGEEAEKRVEDITGLAAAISAAQGLDAFLQEVALMTNLDKAATNGDAVHLTTVHQAKGMEWPVVILPWLVDGLFPSARSVADGNLDEERRLFYVAVTRAKDRLYFVVPRYRQSPDGGIFPVSPSPFISEIPKDLVEDKWWQSASPSPSLRPGSYGASYGHGAGGYGRGGGYGGYGRGSGGSGYGRGGTSRAGGSSDYDRLGGQSPDSYWKHRWSR